MIKSTTRKESRVLHFQCNDFLKEKLIISAIKVNYRLQLILVAVEPVFLILIAYMQFVFYTERKGYTLNKPVVKLYYIGADVL